MTKTGGTGDKTVVNSSEKTVAGRTMVSEKTVASGSSSRSSSVSVPSKIGKYTNIRPLGAGGMGAVYLGEDKELKRTVVIKTLLKSGGSRRARFIREAGILSGLTSQRIVRFYETLESDGKEYVILEYVEGMDLGELLQKDGKLPAEVALWILREICRGLKIAHHQQIVHRDIKPGNILLSKGAQVKITDFGISGVEGAENGDNDKEKKSSTLLSNVKIVNVNLTADSGPSGSTSMGTLSYMAPEQISNVHTADSRADIYSLGVMLYEMVTGCKPYTEDSLKSQYEKIQKETYINPGKFVKGLPKIVNKIVKKCIRFDRKDRFASVDKICKLIDRYLKGFNEKDIRQELANSMQNYPNSQYKYRPIIGKNTKKHKIMGITALILAGLVGIFFLVKAGFDSGFIQRHFCFKKYTPVTIELEFPQIVNSGSGFSPKAYFYTYDDSDPTQKEVVKGVVTSKLINPWHGVELIPDSANPADESLADQVTLMDFAPKKDNPTTYTTKTLFLEPGDYRVKICMGPAVWWKTLVVGSYTGWSKKNTGEVKMSLEYLLSEGRRISFAKPVVVDRKTGEDITANCTFELWYTGKNHKNTEQVKTLKKGKKDEKLTADDVASFMRDDWVSDSYEVKENGETVLKNPVVIVYVSCDGYNTERFGLSLDWYQDKIYVNSALEKKE